MFSPQMIKLTDRVGRWKEDANIVSNNIIYVVISFQFFVQLII